MAKAGISISAKPKTKTAAVVEFTFDPKRKKLIKRMRISPSLAALDSKTGTAKKKQKEKKETISEFEIASDEFTKTLASLQHGLFVVSSVYPVLHSFALNEVQEFAKKHGSTISGRALSTYEIPSNKIGEFLQSTEESKRFTSFYLLLPYIVVLGLVSSYDSFLNKLLFALFAARPELIENSEKTMTYKEIVQVGGIDKATEHIVAKEVETILRESHSDHFVWLGKRLGMKFNEGLKCWPNFIEICERRNLFTHNGGIVSELYLKNCNTVGYEFKDSVRKGEQLKISGEYLTNAVNTFFEVGVKLAYVLWRKVMPAQKDDADSHISNVTYELIRKKRYKLAVEILEFTCTCPDVKDSTRKMMIVNLANSLKLSGDKKRSLEILSKTDWSATSPEFQISAAAVREDYEEAAKLMKSIGRNGPVKKADYHEWPVFIDFRKTEKFKQTYKAVFKVDYNIDEMLIGNGAEITSDNSILEKT
jgi:hypothetical protein